ncbi:MAG: hypothetical protein ACR5LB_07415 [Wolbachia sp.]
MEGGVPLLINVDMNLSSKKFQDHLDKKKVSMTARKYLDHLKDNKNIEEVIQATRSVPFESSKREIEEAEQTHKLKGSSLEQLVKGVLPKTTDETIGRPESYLSGVAVRNQQRSPEFQAISF